jgi:hypothetical protein
MAPRPGPTGGGCPARAAGPHAGAAAAAAGPRSVRTDGRDCAGRAHAADQVWRLTTRPHSLVYRCARSVCADYALVASHRPRASLGTCCGSTQCVRISLTALAKGRWDWDRHRLAGAVSSMPLICPRVGLLHAYMFAYQDRGHRTVLRTVAPRQGPAQHLQDPGSAGPPRPWQQATVHHDQSSHPDERA